MAKISNKPQYYYSIKLESSVFGITLNSSPKGGKVNVALTGAYTDYDGEVFFLILESFTKIFLTPWQNRSHLLSQIENCMIIIHKNGNAQISINIPITLEFLSKKNIKAGDPIFKDDIGDIRKLILGVKIPSKCGFIFIYSFGWRRGLYFDLLPLHDDTYERQEDLSSILASHYVTLLYPEIFSNNQDIQRQLSDLGWFPFIRILGQKFEDLYTASLNNLPIEEIENKILDEFDANRLYQMFDYWMAKKNFIPHGSLIRKGLDEYIEGDPISALHVLYPRIEGVMQLFNIKKIRLNSIKQEIVQKVEQQSHERTLFLPHQFNNYLNSQFLAHFNKNEKNIPLSRHSLSHGVITNPEHFSKIQALQAILTLDQLSFYLE